MDDNNERNERAQDKQQKRNIRRDIYDKKELNEQQIQENEYQQSEQHVRVQPKAHKKTKVFGPALIIFLTAIILYIIFQVIMVSRPSIKTQTAILYEIPDTVFCNGIMAMPQEEIYYDGGITDYLVRNGEKVVNGTKIAQVFETAEQAQKMAQVQKLNSEIDLLVSAQNSTFGVNVEALLSQTLTNLYTLIEYVDTGKYLSVLNVKDDLQTSINKTQIATGATENFQPRIDALSAQRDALQAEIGNVQTIVSPQIGYFVSSTTSFKQMYTADTLKDMSAIEFSEAAKTEVVVNDDNVLGRLIYDYRWTCYVSATAKEAEKFIEGKTVELSFPELTNVSMPATIDKVQVDEDANIAKITLSGDYLNGDFASIQSGIASVTFSANGASVYKGIRIPKDALRIVDGEYGVYIKYGNLLQYRRIQIMFENENYILAPLKYEKGINELRLYDEIVIEGRGLAPKNSEK